MSNNNVSLFRDALVKDSCFVLKQVFVILYRGGNHRPDVYFQQNASLQQKYVFMFTNEQRQTIEASGNPYAYDIETGAELYDLSILWLLVEHTCGLPPSDILLTKVLEIKSLGNSVCYRTDAITRGELCQKLDELLELYITILERVEFHATCYLSFEKTEVERRILEKKSRSQSFPSASSINTPRASPFDSRPAQESCAPKSPTWSQAQSSGAYAVPLSNGTTGAKKIWPSRPTIPKHRKNSFGCHYHKC